MIVDLGGHYKCEQKYAEAYGGGIWWQMALGGLMGGAATGGMDSWGLTNERSNIDLLTRFTNAGLNTFAKDVVKGSAHRCSIVDDNKITSAVMVVVVYFKGNNLADFSHADFRCPL